MAIMLAGTIVLPRDYPGFDPFSTEILSLIHMPSADRLETIAHARQVLLQGRSASVAPTLAPWLQRGWQRCQSWGLEPGQPVGFDPVSAARMRQVQEASQPLVQAARPVLAELVRAMGNMAISPS